MLVGHKALQLQHTRKDVDATTYEPLREMTLPLPSERALFNCLTVLDIIIHPLVFLHNKKYNMNNDMIFWISSQCGVSF
jgi:hypothetical protein